MTKIKIPSILKKMNAIFSANGYEAYLVGGAVRDIIRGKKASDWDIATNAKPEDVKRIFKKVIPTGIEHGTVTVHFMGAEIEVTTYRTETDYSDGRHPDAVKYAATIEEDLSRRDFTMNAIAASLNDGKIEDPFNGETDIKNRIIRTVGNADERFSEDGLRPVRAVRFAAQTGFDIEENTLKAIPRAENVTARISIERFRDEFVKLLSSDMPSRGLRLMEETGILKRFLPELAYCRNVLQADERGFHKFDVLDHLYYACDGATWLQNERKAEPDVNVRMAALFHDIAKPLVKKTEHKALDPQNPEKISEIYTFFNHDIKGAEVTEKILERLRFPKSTVRYVAHLVKQHMFFYESTWTDAAVRRFIVRITPPKSENGDFSQVMQALNDLFDLRIADVCGMQGTPAILRKGPWSENLMELKERIEKLSAQATALSLKDLAVSGKDLMAIGIPAGKTLGLILNELLETVIDSPEQNTKESLLKIAAMKAEKL